MIDFFNPARPGIIYLSPNDAIFHFRPKQDQTKMLNGTQNDSFDIILCKTSKMSDSPSFRVYWDKSKAPVGNIQLEQKCPFSWLCYSLLGWFCITNPGTLQTSTQGQICGYKSHTCSLACMNERLLKILARVIQRVPISSILLLTSGSRAEESLITGSSSMFSLNL